MGRAAGPPTGSRCWCSGSPPFSFVDADTSYVLLCAFSFVLGLGMGMAMMPTMTAALQAVPKSAIARTSTAMNILRQSGASIGTAILSVLLSTAIADKHSRAPAPLAEAFAQTFRWGLALLALALVPALAMALGGRRVAPWPCHARREIGARERVTPESRRSWIASGR